MEDHKKTSVQQGHWVLANVGKKVLRPGGIELTQKMIASLHINSEDDVVEFAPGLGLTAAITCAQKPRSYTAVDRSAEAADIVKNRLKGTNAKVIIANASETTLPDACATKVYGEAMLSMHGKSHKQGIINEAARILKPGGLYGIHELGLTSNHMDEELKKQIYRDMAQAVQSPVQPLSLGEWTALLEEAGFKVIAYHTNPMHLLSPKRMIKDEGLFRFLAIMLRILPNKAVRQRVKGMRDVFQKYSNELNAITIIAQKQ